jgi:hypothetical protein
MEQDNPNVKYTIVAFDYGKGDRKYYPEIKDKLEASLNCEFYIGITVQPLTLVNGGYVFINNLSNSLDKTDNNHICLVMREDLATQSDLWNDLSHLAKQFTELGICCSAVQWSVDKETQKPTIGKIDQLTFN